jgi:hypothetical protein
MMAVEAALSVFLLCGAALIGQNLWRLISTSAGFDPQNVTVMQMRMPYRRERALQPNPSRGYQEYHGEDRRHSERRIRRCCPRPAVTRRHADWLPPPWRSK